ncbi:MAG: acetate--CoA ligase [Myxococcota bacterium]|nr:acetate--CoA ligase [Myxococcota bacterium]
MSLDQTQAAVEPIYACPDELRTKAHISGRARYDAMYRRSIDDPDGFWAEQAGAFLTWFRRWDTVSESDFATGASRWFIGGKLNASYNCLDRHIEKRGDRVALIWEGSDPAESVSFTYRRLHELVCKAANALRGLGVRKGDRVCIFLPMIPELAVTVLACARIGAIHSVVFGGFSAESLRDRIIDSTSKVLVTCDGTFRGAKPVPLKAVADEATRGTPSIEKRLVVRRTGIDVAWDAARDVWWDDAVGPQSAECEPEVMDAEDPLFILYTSGSTGKPKGVLHTTGGYLAYVACTHKWVFDYHDGDIYWCTADIGWVTGHSYIVYGPLANGATTVMFEGVPNYPDWGRFWAVVAKHKVNIFYTAPTAIRAIMREGDEWVRRHDLSSLRVLGSVGEPINPAAWEWYWRVVGGGRCPIVDTWWQTETGGILIAPLPGAIDQKPGSATLPFFGIVPSIVDEIGNEMPGEASGRLCINRSWPGIARGLWGQPERFRETYFTLFRGKYFTGDGARRDEDGYYWITGRVDDVINVSGHRIGTAEIESAIVKHPSVAEAAVVGMPHDIKGQGIYAYVTLKVGVAKTDALLGELIAWVRREIGPIATPDKIQWADGLPKTRSGKIMRRILRKIAAGEIHELGDTSTLADPTVVAKLIEGRA